MNHPHERRGEIGGTRRPEPKDGQSSRRLKLRLWVWKIDWVWRRIVPLVALGLAMVAIVQQGDKLDATQAQVEASREGRRVAREVLCGGLVGVQDAGRMILLGTLPPPAPPTPPISKAELAERVKFARAYSEVISRRMLDQAGVEAKAVLRDDGTIDCDALNRVSTQGG